MVEEQDPTCYLLVTVPAWGVPSTGLVVNEVYGGGGNSGSFYNRDFIELTNRGPDPVGVAGWSVQYHSSSATGTWQVTALTGVIAPGALFLVGEATGTSGAQQPLPAVDVSGTKAMSATAGTVAVVAGTAALTCTADTCASEASIIDLVG